MSTGQCLAHHCCAAWSEGVIQADDYSLLYVDKAVFNGLSQVKIFTKSVSYVMLVVIGFFFLRPVYTERQRQHCDDASNFGFFEIKWELPENEVVTHFGVTQLISVEAVSLA